MTMAAMSSGRWPWNTGWSYEARIHGNDDVEVECDLDEEDGQ